MKQAIIIGGLAALVCVVFALSNIDPIPPRSVTATRMHAMKRRVLQYAKAHDELPKSLATLPKMEGYDSSLKDGWKRDILFRVADSTVVSLRSLGRDGVIGGSGEDADIVRSFRARDAGGNWSDELVDWSEDTLKP